MSCIKDFDQRMKDLEIREQQFKTSMKQQEASFDEERRAILEEKRRARLSERDNFLHDLTKEIARDYDMSFEQAEIVVNQAWDRGHGSGYDEVTAIARDYGEWVEKILDIQRNIDY